MIELNEVENIDINLNEEENINVDVGSEIGTINDISEVITNENKRQENEKERITYYNQLKQDVLDGKFKGDTGEKGEPGINGIDGQPGENGKSAYAIALENGFEGSEEEWLISLKGSKGENGKDGITPSFSIGNVETLEPDDNAMVIQTGTEENPILNFKIPRGYDGTNISSNNVIELKYFGEYGIESGIVGEKYYNTLENKIYTRVNEIWTNPETPEEEVLYINLQDGCLYYYEDIEDGKMVKASGGGGAGVYVGSVEDAPEGTKLVINPNSVKSKSNYVTDSLVGNETDKAPSVRAVNDALNKLMVYSTEEQVIGMWFNKPLYRRGFIGTTGTTNFITLTDENNIEEIVSSKGNINNNSADFEIGKSTSYNSNETHTSSSRIIVANNNLRLDYGNSLKSSNFKVAVEYTKTTDKSINIQSEVNN